jgi:hypothetical protein
MDGKRPAKELRGIQRVCLQPGEKRTLTFTVPAEKLAYWDESSHAFVVNPGAFDILVAPPRKTSAKPPASEWSDNEHRFRVHPSATPRSPS